VEKQCALRAFNELRLLGFENARCTRIFGFPAAEISLNNDQDEDISDEGEE
jgi:hypothetical protein